LRLWESELTSHTQSTPESDEERLDCPETPRQS
jgi:hypothetical protein